MPLVLQVAVDISTSRWQEVSLFHCSKCLRHHLDTVITVPLSSVEIDHLLLGYPVVRDGVEFRVEDKEETRYGPHED